MTIKLRIPGQPEAVSNAAARGASAGDVSVQPLTHLRNGLEVVETFNPSAPALDRTVGLATKSQGRWKFAQITHSRTTLP